MVGREWFDTTEWNLTDDGHCRSCGTKCSGVFSGNPPATDGRLMPIRIEELEQTTEVRYNPMGYHTGAIWPHDNALIALGLTRYGFEREAVELLTGLFEASFHFDLHRMPELFCGFQQVHGEGPILYPLACSPQSWASASVFLLLQACLGLDIDVTKTQVRFVRPQLPSSLRELRIHNLEVGKGTAVDLLFVRHEEDVSVTVLRREGHVQVMVLK